MGNHTFCGQSGSCRKRKSSISTGCNRRPRYTRHRLCPLKPHLTSPEPIPVTTKTQVLQWDPRPARTIFRPVEEKLLSRPSTREGRERGARGAGQAQCRPSRAPKGQNGAGEEEPRWNTKGKGEVHAADEGSGPPALIKKKVRTYPKKRNRSQADGLGKLKESEGGLTANGTDQDR